MKTLHRQQVHEGLRLPYRHRLQRADHDKGCTPVGQKPLDFLRPRDKTLGKGLEQYEELGYILEELRADDLVGHVVKRLRGNVGQPALVRHGQKAQQPRAEEIGCALRGQQKIESVARRRSIHDDQVVIALGMKLV